MAVQFELVGSEENPPQCQEQSRIVEDVINKTGNGAIIPV